MFSNWIVVWTFMYLFGLVKFNPFFANLVALTENIIGVFIFKGSSQDMIALCFLTLCAKVLPLCYMIYRGMTKIEIWPAVFLFALYLFWIYVNGIQTKDKIIQLYFGKQSCHPVLNMLKKF
jgi:hypothetical protein